MVQIHVRVGILGLLLGFDPSELREFYQYANLYVHSKAKIR